MSFLVLIRSSIVLAEAGTGLQTSASVDIVGQAGTHAGSGATDRIDVREAEFMLYAPADHLFDGVVSFSAHAAAGVAAVELHEGYMGSTKIIPRSRFKVGQFFLGIGRLNQYHRHDWPFITAPKVQQDFFSDHGVLDTGGEFSYLTPLPFYLEVTLGITNGFTYGHDHSAGSRPLLPTNYARLTTYTSLPWDGGTQIGLNYLGRRGGEGTQRTLFGVDLTAKWKENGVLAFLFQSEVWYRTLTPSGSDTQEALGMYLYPQYYLGSNCFLGLRLDYFSTLTLKDSFGAGMKNYDVSLVPTFTYKASEFAHIRLAYNHTAQYEVDRYIDTTRLFEAQALFILGAHPAHDF